MREITDVAGQPQWRVVKQLREWIRDGVLESGDRVPSERRLAAKLGVDRGTARRALGHLEKEGWLARNSSGRRVVAWEGQRQGGGLWQRTIAVLTPVPEGSFREHRASGWSEFVSHGAIHAIREHGLQAVTMEPGQFGTAEVAELLAVRPLGVIVTDCMWDLVKEWLPEAVGVGLPVVVYGDDPEMAGYDRVSSDHELGSFQLTRWALEQGVRRIGAVWRRPYHGYWCPLRLAGFRRAMESAGLSPGPVIEWQRLPGEWPLSEAREEMVRRIAGHLVEHMTGPERLEAILVPSDGELYPVCLALRLFGLEPNRDVLMLGYDNYWSDCVEFQGDLAPPAATVDKLNMKLGAELIDLLLARIDGRLPAGPQLRLLPPQLVPLRGREKI